MRRRARQTGRPARLLEGAQIPARFQNASFENFILPERRENPLANETLSKAMLDAKLFSREYPFTEKAGLLFMGLPGVGKTHLATAALKVMIERGFESVFLDYQGLLDRIRSGFGGQLRREVPELERDVTGLAMIERLARQMYSE